MGRKFVSDHSYYCNPNLLTKYPCTLSYRMEMNISYKWRICSCKGNFLQEPFPGSPTFPKTFPRGPTLDAL